MCAVRTRSEVRPSRVKQYLLAKLLLHGVHVCLLLFAQSNVLADPAAPRGSSSTGPSRAEVSRPGSPHAGALRDPLWIEPMRCRRPALVRSGPASRSASCLNLLVPQTAGGQSC